jgi:hypothetical protein
MKNFGMEEPEQYISSTRRPRRAHALRVAFAAMVLSTFDACVTIIRRLRKPEVPAGEAHAPKIYPLFIMPICD